MEFFNKYAELQNLLLTMDDDQKIDHVKNFIDENGLLKNKNKTLSTIRLIASVVFTRPNLLYNASKLLKLFTTINMYHYLQFFSSDDIADDEIIARFQLIPLLFIMSDHSSINHQNQMFVFRQSFLYPQKYFLKDLNSLYDSKQIANLSDQEKIEKRNKMHSFHPVVEFLNRDDLDSLQSYISNNNFNINNKIPKSFFEMHLLLKEATPLEYSAFLGSINCFKFLVKNTKDINCKKLLSCAFAGGNYDIIHMIEKEFHGEYYKKDNNYLYQAILYMHNDLIEYILLNYPIKIDSESYIKCIYSSNYSALLKLIELDDSDQINEFGLIGSTPLDIAAFEGYLDFLKFLLSIKKVDPKKLNSFGKTILQSAARSNKLYIVKYIVKHKLVDIDDKGNFGFSPIRLSINYYCVGVFKYLKQFSNDYDENQIYFDEEEEEEEDKKEDN